MPLEAARALAEAQAPVLRHHREHARLFAAAAAAASVAEEGGDDDDDDRLLLHDEGVEETEGGAMHPRAEELLQAHLAKADHAGYQRMQVGAVGAATGS